MSGIFISDKLLNMTFWQKIKLLLLTPSFPLKGCNILPHEIHYGPCAKWQKNIWYTSIREKGGYIYLFLRCAISTTTKKMYLTCSGWCHAAQTVPMKPWQVLPHQNENKAYDLFLCTSSGKITGSIKHSSHNIGHLSKWNIPSASWAREWHCTPWLSTENKAAHITTTDDGCPPDKAGADTGDWATTNGPTELGSSWRNPSQFSPQLVNKMTYQ